MAAPTEITIEQLDRVPSVGTALEMLRAVSLAADENELFAAFAHRFRELSCVTHLMSLMIDGCGPGRFRVMLELSLDGSPVTPEQVRAISRYHAPLDQTPERSSPVLSGLVAGEAPKLIRSCPPAEDPLLAAALTEPSDIIAIPIFNAGRVTEYAVMCMPPDDNPMDEAGLRTGIGNINFMSRCIETLVVKNQIERLNTKLDAQMTEIGRVQRSLLPGSWPDEPRLTIATSYLPSEAAGGDYFDYRTFPRPGAGPESTDDLIGLVIADVSGHGPVAAVTMAVFRTAMLATQFYTTDPARTVPDVNAMVFHSVEPGTFVTAFLITIDPATGQAVYACCGHNPPRIRRAGGTVEPIEGCGGPPFGILPDLEPVGDAFTLQPGDSLVLYTDGITEAFSPDHELFGTDRLDAAIAGAGSEPEAIRRSILDAVALHAGTRPRDDDQTLVIVRYNGGEA
ncbi:MAG: PP2C family protein-serine/threonine phosphatase [Planctomycetota bacterium]